MPLKRDNWGFDMKQGLSKLLVIDANVLLAAGDERLPDPRPVLCKDFLEAVRKICHRIVATPRIIAEWKKPPRKGQKGRRLRSFSLRWLAQMNGKKKIVYKQDLEDRDLRSKIQKEDLTESEREEILADIHLVEAALAADSRIISCDEKARALFGRIAARIGQIRGVAWVNPEHRDETPLNWLENGAPTDTERLLGRRNAAE